MIVCCSGVRSGAGANAAVAAGKRWVTLLKELALIGVRGVDGGGGGGGDAKILLRSMPLHLAIGIE